MNRTLAALGMVLAMTVAAASASAQGASHSKANSDVQDGTSTATATGNGSTASATATCPPGTKAEGGGFDAPSSSQVMGIVYESVKVDQHAWRASVQLLDPGAADTLTLTTYVYCRAHTPATHTSSQTVPTSGSIQLGPTASATCPRGETAVAGGFHMPPPLKSPTVTDLFFDSVRDGASGWDGRVVTGPAGPSNVTSEAYCSASADLPVEADGSALSGDDGTTGTALATCPDGLTPADGGFAQPESDLNSFFFVTSSRRLDGGWQVTGLHSGSDPQVTLQAVGYCG